VQRLSIVLPPNTVLNSLALSPDGQRLAYVANGPTGLSKLWLRSMDSTQAEQIPDTDNAAQPFWSPDSRSIGFFTEREMKKLIIGGGPPEKLADVAIPRGGTWNQYGDILFAPKGSEGLYRISAQGGEAKVVTILDQSRKEGRHFFPQFLPDGRHFFFTVNGFRPEYTGVFIASLDSKDRKKIRPDLTPVRYIEPGYLFFVRNNKLMAQQFENKRFELTGDPIPLADNNSNNSTGPHFAASNNLLVFGDVGGWSTQPSWFDRSGKQSSPFKNYPPVLGEPGSYSFCDLSFDDRRLLTMRRESSPDAAESNVMFMVDLLTGSFHRYAMTNETEAVFSPDGSQVAYSPFIPDSERKTDLYIRSSDGTSKAELLYQPKYQSNYGIANLFWSPDGRFLSFTSLSPKTNFDLWVLPLNGERKAFVYLGTSAREESNVFSPNGKWVAYQSYQSGRAEIYVRSFPAEAGGVWAISTHGGEQPVWRRDGKELFYLTLDKKLMAMQVQTGDVFKPEITRLLFQTNVEPRIIGRIGATKQYFASSDGNHFLVNTLIENKDPEVINVLVNWTSLLKNK
jgi:Tol biopolymer transport system component